MKPSNSQIFGSNKTCLRRIKNTDKPFDAKKSKPSRSNSRVDQKRCSRQSSKSNERSKTNKHAKSSEALRVKRGLASRHTVSKPQIENQSKCDDKIPPSGRFMHGSEQTGFRRLNHGS